MTSAVSKKKASASKGADVPERGRPRIIRVADHVTFNENGQIEMKARSRQTVHGLSSIDTDVRIFRLPPGTLFLQSLHPWWVTRDVRLVDHMVLEECQVSCLVYAENPTIIHEGDAIGVLQPLASAKIEMKRGEDD